MSELEHATLRSAEGKVLYAITQKKDGEITCVNGLRSLYTATDAIVLCMNSGRTKCEQYRDVEEFGSDQLLLKTEAQKWFDKETCLLRAVLKESEAETKKAKQEKETLEAQLREKQAELEAVTKKLATREEQDRAAAAAKIEDARQALAVVKSKEEALQAMLLEFAEKEK